MGYRKQLTNASAVDTRTKAAPAGVQVYVAPNPDGTGQARGIVEFDDGAAGDVPAQLVQSNNPNPRSISYPFGQLAINGGSYAAVSGVVAAPDLLLAVDQDPATNYTTSRRAVKITGADVLDLGGARVLDTAKPCARARRLTQLTNSGWTVITWDTKDVDTRGDQYGTSGLTVRVAGLYRVNAGFALTASATAGRRAVNVLKNGASTYLGRLQPAGVAEAGVECNGMIQLAAGDVLSIQVYQDTGATANTDGTVVYAATYIEAEWLRP